MEDEKLEDGTIALEFPMVYSGNCPVCGSLPVIRQVADVEIAKGKCGADLPYGFPAVAPVMDPKKTVLSAPFLLLTMDVCSNKSCGLVFCKRIDRTDMSTTVAMPGQGMPRRMG